MIVKLYLPWNYKSSCLFRLYDSKLDFEIYVAGMLVEERKAKK